MGGHGTYGRPRAPELDSAHLPAPRPLYIGQCMLIGECPKLLIFRLFSGT